MPTVRQASVAYCCSSRHFSASTTCGDHGMYASSCRNASHCRMDLSSSSNFAYPQVPVRAPSSYRREVRRVNSYHLPRTCPYACHQSPARLVIFIQKAGVGQSSIPVADSAQRPPITPQLDQEPSEPAARRRQVILGASSCSA